MKFPSETADRCKKYHSVSENVILKLSLICSFGHKIRNLGQNVQNNDSKQRYSINIFLDLFKIIKHFQKSLPLFSLLASKLFCASSIAIPALSLFVYVKAKEYSKIIIEEIKNKKEKLTNHHM